MKATAPFFIRARNGKWLVRAGDTYAFAAASATTRFVLEPWASAPHGTAGCVDGFRLLEAEGQQGSQPGSNPGTCSSLAAAPGCDLSYVGLRGDGSCCPSSVAIFLALEVVDNNGARFAVNLTRSLFRTISGGLLAPGPGGVLRCVAPHDGHLFLRSARLQLIAASPRPLPRTPMRMQLRSWTGAYLCAAAAADGDGGAPLRCGAAVPCCCEELIVDLLPPSPTHPSPYPESEVCQCNRAGRRGPLAIFAAALAAVCAPRRPQCLLFWCPVIAAAVAGGTLVAARVASAPRNDAPLGTRVVLRTGDGSRCLSAEPGGGGRVTAVGLDSSRGGELWDMCVAPGRHRRPTISLRGAASGMHLTAAEKGGRLAADRPAAKRWERFGLEPAAGGKPLLLRACHGGYVAHPPGGDVASQAASEAAADAAALAAVVASAASRYPPQALGPALLPGRADPSPPAPPRPKPRLSLPARCMSLPRLWCCLWSLRPHGDGLFTVVSAPPPRAGPECYLAIDASTGQVVTTVDPNACFPDISVLWELELLCSGPTESGFGGWALRTAGPVAGTRRYLSACRDGRLVATRTCAHGDEAFSAVDLGGLCPPPRSPPRSPIQGAVAPPSCDGLAPLPFPLGLTPAPLFVLATAAVLAAGGVPAPAVERGGRRWVGTDSDDDDNDNDGDNDAESESETAPRLPRVGVPASIHASLAAAACARSRRRPACKQSLVESEVVDAPPGVDAAGGSRRVVVHDGYVCRSCVGGVMHQVLQPMSPGVNPAHHRYLSTQLANSYGGRLLQRARAGGASAVWFLATMLLASGILFESATAVAGGCDSGTGMVVPPPAVLAVHRRPFHLRAQI